MEFKTKPFAHQLDEFDKSKEWEHRGLFWEMGTGKTKPVLDTIAHLYLARKIEGVLVLAPNGVHRNWVSDEIPAHLPDEVAAQLRVLMWQTKKAKTKWFQAKVEELHAHLGLSLLAISYDGFMTKEGSRAAKRLLTKRRCLYVLDEAQFAKTPRAARTKRVLASGPYAPYRRALTGTPVDDSPFDVYTQGKFLDPGVWKRVGIHTAAEFKVFFGVWEHPELVGKKLAKDGVRPQLLKYKNLEILNGIVAELGSRVLKEDVLDLPPKLYTKRYFTMSPAQERIYKELEKESRAELAAAKTVTAQLAITRILRLQQVTSGYVPADDEEHLTTITHPNPRLIELAQLLGEVPHKAIVWAKYRNDVDMIMELCKQKKWEAVRYDGKVDPEGRADSIERFQRGSAKLFVANPAVGGEGITLHAARTVIYYNTTYRLGKRLQSEDRAHRIGQEHPVTYVDLIAIDTVDGKIIRALRAKKNVADLVMGDEIAGWI